MSECACVRVAKTFHIAIRTYVCVESDTNMYNEDRANKQERTYLTEEKRRGREREPAVHKHTLLVALPSLVESRHDSIFSSQASGRTNVRLNSGQLELAERETVPGSSLITP